jgi:hypothetical protein
MQELQVYIRNKWMKKETVGESGGGGERCSAGTVIFRNNVLDFIWFTGESLHLFRK